jgi:hypothetical protein
MKPLIFLHVPKCAGTTVITALRGIYGDALYHDATFRQIKKRHLAWQWQINLPLTQHQDDLPKPQARCIVGHFTWMKYRHLEWPTFLFLRNPYHRLISQYSIGENREIAGFDDYVRRAPNNVSRMVGDLENYFFVGLLEHFEESMKMLEWYAGIEFNWPLEYRNYHKREKYRLTETDHRILLECNKEDFQLYDQARVRFYQQRAEYYERIKKQANTA